MIKNKWGKEVNIEEALKRHYTESRFNKKCNNCEQHNVHYNSAWVCHECYHTVDGRIIADACLRLQQKEMGLPMKKSIYTAPNEEVPDE